MTLGILGMTFCTWCWFLHGVYGQMKWLYYKMGFHLWEIHMRCVFWTSLWLLGNCAMTPSVVELYTLNNLAYILEILLVFYSTCSLPAVVSWSLGRLWIGIFYFYLKQNITPSQLLTWYEVFSYRQLLIFSIVVFCWLEFLIFSVMIFCWLEL